MISIKELLHKKINTFVGVVLIFASIWFLYFMAGNIFVEEPDCLAMILQRRYYESKAGNTTAFPLSLEYSKYIYWQGKGKGGLPIYVVSTDCKSINSNQYPETGEPVFYIDKAERASDKPL